MRKRLLFITPGLGKGGAETQLLKVARECSKIYETRIISLKPINNFSEDLGNYGIRVIFLKNWKLNFVSNSLNLLREVRNFKPDAVIAFMFIAIIASRLLKKIFKFRLISSVRNSAIGKKWYFLYKSTCKLDDIVVFNSHASKSNFYKLKLAGANSVVINNAITPVPTAAESSPLSRDPFIWISIAHFRPSKDYKTLFKAIQLIKDKNFRVDIIGHLNNLDWPYQYIKQLDIEQRVRILGFKENSADYLRVSNALVLSSFNEGMPNAILEAMAYGKPVVASNIDGVKELLIGSKCGLLFDAGNAADLAEKMTEIMNSPLDEVQLMSSNGITYIDRHFTDQRVKQQWLGLIEGQVTKGKVVETVCVL